MELDPQWLVFLLEHSREHRKFLVPDRAHSFPALVVSEWGLINGAGCGFSRYMILRGTVGKPAHYTFCEYPIADGEESETISETVESRGSPQRNSSKLCVCHRVDAS
jgi:hypothetical protein